MIGRRAAADPDQPRLRAARPVTGIIGTGVIGGLALASGLAVTATSGWLIVAASLRPQILTLLAAIVLVRAFGIAGPGLRYAERVRGHDHALAWLARERAAVYARLIPLTPARLGRRARGEVLAGVVDDLDDLAYAQVRVVVPLVSLLVTGAVAVGLDAVVLPAAAVVAASTMACCLLVGVLDWWLERRALPGALAARGRLTQLAALVATNATELAAIGAAGAASGWVEAAQADLVGATRRQRWGRAFATTAIPLVVAGHTMWMALLAAPLVSDALSRPLPTPLAALLVLTPVALGEVAAAVLDAAGSLARSQAAAARLNALLDQRPAVTHPRVDTRAATEPDQGATAGSGRTPIPTAVPRLALDRVTGSWDGHTVALGPQTLRLRPGGLIGITGPNGSGKSTLLAILARHLDPQTGRYRQDDTDVADLSLADARRRLAVVDDEPHVFASTVRENLRMAAPGCSDEAILAAIDRAGLRTWYDALPRGLSTLLGSGTNRSGEAPEGAGLSGGERTRLALARALLSARGVLLLDEPVAHLDHATAIAVMRDVAATAAGDAGTNAPPRTVIVVSHRPEGLDDADTMIRVMRPTRGGRRPGLRG